MSWWHSKENRINHGIIQGSLYYQPRQCTIIREIPQNYHKFALFDSSNMGNLMTPVFFFHLPMKPYSNAEHPTKIIQGDLRHSTDWRLCPTPRKQKCVLRKPYICEWCRQQNELCVSKNAETIIVCLFVGEGRTQIIPSSNCSTLRLKNTLTSGRRKACCLFVTRLYCFRWEVPRANRPQTKCQWSRVVTGNCAT